MLEKGKYRIEKIVSISESLLSQAGKASKEEAEDISEREAKAGVMKALLSTGERKEDASKIVYFIEKVSFGTGTIIEIPKDRESPLLTNADFRVEKEIRFRRDLEFIKRLLPAGK